MKKILNPKLLMAVLVASFLIALVDYELNDGLTFIGKTFAGIIGVILIGLAGFVLFVFGKWIVNLFK